MNMSFAEYLDWFVENSDLFPNEIENKREKDYENIGQLKF